MTQPSFAVCAMVRETPDVLHRFARHYLSLGAERVRLFFDGEAHEAEAPDLPGVDLVLCDRTFWEKHLGHQPANFQEAHHAVFRLAHETATSDWQFFCDADEFLVAHIPVGEMLGAIPAGREVLQIPNAEAVWGPGDVPGAAFGCTWFRTILSRRKERLLRLLLPGRRWAFFGRGLPGHTQGKHFLRRGTVVHAFNSHFPSRDGASLGGLWSPDIGYGLERVFLAHFDAVSEARWTEKWRRRLSKERSSSRLHPQRRAQSDAIAAASAAGRLDRLFREMYVLSVYEAVVLSATRSVIRHRVFPET